MNITKIGRAVLVALAMTATAAHANIITYTAPADLAAVGRITQTTNFDSYPSGLGESTPVSAGAVLDRDFSMRADSAAHIAAPLLTTRALLTGGAGVEAFLDIAGEHDLFGFDAAYFSTGSNATFNVTTNLGTYVIEGDLIRARDGFRYYGFQADAGEYFTGFSFVGNVSVGVNDLQLGTTAADSDPADVPEPGSLALVFAGIGMAALARRKKA
jgi:hypothetical protein